MEPKPQTACEILGDALSCSIRQADWGPGVYLVVERSAPERPILRSCKFYNPEHQKAIRATTPQQIETKNAELDRPVWFTYVP